MSFNWYQCDTVELQSKKNSCPSSSGSSAKTFNWWTKLAEVGDINYSCKKCGTTIHPKSSPSRVS